VSHPVYVLEFAGFEHFLQPVIIMKQTNDQSLKWELDRERFRIEDRFPPPERHPERRISDILTGLLRKEDAEDIVLPDVIAERWPVIAGEQLASHVRPSHLKNGILYLQADHPGWLAELRRLPKAGLLKKIASIPDIPEIKDIRFQLDPAIRTGRK
jgi:predicted nucleic acid-binding Zn ribbon protein